MGVNSHLCALTTSDDARSTPACDQRCSSHDHAEPAYAASTCSQAPTDSHAAAQSGTGSTDADDVVPTVATTAQTSSPRRNACALRHLGQFEPEQPHRLLDRRVRVLRRDDRSRTRLRLARGRERGDRRRRRGVLDVPVPAAGKAEQLRDPVERHLLELLQRRRRAPEDSDVVQRCDQQLRQDTRLRPGDGEVREVARALPVRDPGHEHLVEVAQHVGERLTVLRRRLRQPRADLARLDLSQHRQVADALEVRRRPLERRRPVPPQVDGRRFLIRSICFHVRVFTTSDFVSHARRAWPMPNST